MQRRDVLRFLTSAAALSALPSELIVALQEARGQTSLSAGLRTLNSRQNALVTAVSEIIIPETDTPGAKGAQVNEFIDLILTDWFDAAETVRFLKGLTQIDEESRNKFGTNFVDCNASQQTDVLKHFDDAAMAFARTHKNAEAAPEPTNFFYTFKRLTLVGYYTSEIGFKQELHKTIIPPSHSGCAPLPEVRS